MNSETEETITSEMSAELSSAAETCNGRKRKRQAQAAHSPKRFNTMQEGEETPTRRHVARVSVQPDRLQQPITQSELTELLHYAALGAAGGVKQPSWCCLHHQKRVKAVNVVIVEGLTQSDFYQHYLAVQHLRTSYSTRVTFTPSPTNLASGIFGGEVPESDDPSLHQRPSGSSPVPNELRIHPIIAKFGTQKRGLTAYVLTQEEMIQNRYPVKGMPGFEEFVCTDGVDCVTDSSPLYGLDCEMCLTEKGYELTRVSLVDSDGKCLLDQLVKPPTRILNYLTKFSGITRKMLRPITTTLRDVQVKVVELLPSDAVLVGHSLDNDLAALKLIHQHVIDTSLLYRREFGRFKLKVLAESVLQKQIQTEEMTGHNPIEDAVAALELAQYFIKMGPRQVVELHLELWGCTIVDEPSEPEPEPEPEPSLRFADILQTLGRSVAFFGKRSDLPLDLSNQQWYNSDKEVVASFRRQTKCPFLSVVQISSLSDHLRRCPTPPEHQRAPAILRDTCVVFAGPFPGDFSERNVRRLFRCCGPVRKIKMLTTTVRVHAEVEFELLEGAVLALNVFNGLNIRGQSIKVQRPVYESTLDLDLTLEALQCDRLNTSRLYVTLSPSVAKGVSANGHEAYCRVNGTGAPQLTEEAIRETFGHFGSVERVVLSAQHAHIKFESSEARHAALSASEALLKDYVVCPSLTPAHLTSWDASGGEERTHAAYTSSQDQEMDLMLRKLDRRLSKLFGFLPEGTLSVVVLLGSTSADGHLPGLCLMEVKQGEEND
ncbi:RNA exonuclease 5-like isoform X2 [Cyclopterus lumpus]|uniref:RNA exonuclease 5-like isoform X2 n=1 Tax=Cyclopterus lumpus TaxID=8103 RepID=UPI001486D661|nr:RNA exonuclease 5-like isoform X2 [Cyclopterus lumpus]XP_034409489.1 RNA exonuclease 5-like isoform X2 [Cyclopterus lumpus]